MPSSLFRKLKLSSGAVVLVICSTTYAQTDPPPSAPIKASESAIPAGERYIDGFL